MSARLLVCDLGLMHYHEAWELQRSVQEKLISEKQAARNEKPVSAPSPDVLLFVEHPHVYTLGKSGKEEHLLQSIPELAKVEAEFVKIDRGGDITYHGPGQIVGYPIIDLDRHFTDIHKYLRFLEEVIIQTCSDFNIRAGRIEGLTGVWVKGSKICAMGIRSSRWVTMHGFALNVNTNLEYFENIVPCGISDKPVSSLQQLLGREINKEEVSARILYHFQKIFSFNSIKKVSPDNLKEQFSYL